MAVSATNAYFRTPSGWQIWDGITEHLLPAYQTDEVAEVQLSLSTGLGIQGTVYLIGSLRLSGSLSGDT